MRTGRLFVPLLVGFGLVLLLMRDLGGQHTQVMAASGGSCWARVDDDSTDYASVQEAVDAASDGALVKVAGYCAGVEGRGGMTQTVYISRPVTLRGGYTVTNWTTPNATAHTTALDAEEQGRVIAIVGGLVSAGEKLSVTLEGLDITRGRADGLGGGRGGRDAGGGVYLRDAQARVVSCRVSKGAAQQGGGLYLSDSWVDLEGSTVASNTATGDGGGVSVYRSGALVIRSTIAENHALRWGGGLYLSESDSVSVTQSAIVSNTSAEDGGGVHLNISNITMKDTLVEDNTAEDDGGGLYVYRAQTVVVRASHFLENSAKDKGGAVHLREGRLDLVNDVIAANTAGKGSGVYLDNGSSEVIHTTIARNEGDSGICLAGQSTSLFTNTILVGHMLGIHVMDGGTVSLARTLLGSGIWANQRDWSVEGILSTDSRNYWEPPDFRDPDAGDYRIGPASGAVDRGLHAGVSGDIDGDPRPMGPAPDLGADEIWRVYLPLAPRLTGNVEAEQCRPTKTGP